MAPEPSQSELDRPIFELESSGSYTAEDARHWIEVYTQLIDFCHRLDAREDPSSSGRAELAARLQLFERRLNFWAQRLQQDG